MLSMNPISLSTYKSGNNDIRGGLYPYTPYNTNLKEFSLFKILVVISLLVVCTIKGMEHVQNIFMTFDKNLF